MFTFVLLVISSVSVCMLCVHIWYIPAKSLPSALKQEVHRLRTLLYHITTLMLVLYIIGLAYIVYILYEQIVNKDTFSITVLLLLSITLIAHVVTMLQIKRNALHAITSMLYIFLAAASLVYTISLFAVSMQKIVTMWLIIVAVTLVLRYAVSAYRNYI